MIKRLLNKLHIHYFNKPVAVGYVSFNYRRVMFECRCGKRKYGEMHHDDYYKYFFNKIPNCISFDEFNKMLKERN
jgi:hypothetical protein